MITPPRHHVDDPDRALALEEHLDPIIADLQQAAKQAGYTEEEFLAALVSVADNRMLQLSEIAGMEHRIASCRK